nr:uncharacterized protein LOC106017841 isoform X3 [Anas platyrhynchos]
MEPRIGVRRERAERRGGSAAPARPCPRKPRANPAQAPRSAARPRLRATESMAALGDQLCGGAEERLLPPALHSSPNPRGFVLKPDAAREAALLHMAGGAACEGQILLPVLLEREGSDLCRANVITSALARAEISC